MGQALYRKYRSKTLSEIVGQEHITRTLENALKTGKLSHAYLFTGPRGVGKTSIARILAHEINGLPYTDESIHLDIIEIDAASNRRIDEIRDLRDKVHIAPTSAKYKVYIIDEVHMLTKEAFNALLKTLEEPPAHVVFILATTELHKLPETIVSRTQRFTFKLIDYTTVAGHLKEIAKQEGMHIDDDALELLARHGRGSFRDSISLLDQVGHSAKKVSRADAEKLVGLAATEHIDALLDNTLSGTPADILRTLDQLVSDGVSPAQTAKQLAAVVRNRILQSNIGAEATTLLGNLLEVNTSADPATKLEVVLLSANLTANPSAAPAASPAVKKTSPAKADAAEVGAKPTPKQAHAEARPAAVTQAPNPEPATVEQSAVLTGDPAEWWTDVLTQVKAINNTLYGAMRMAVPKVDGDTLHLGFKFKLHARKVTEPEVQKKLHEAIQAVTGRAYTIKALVDKSFDPDLVVVTEKTVAPAEPETATPLNSVINVFGGGEVLES